jgi:hypothetical protein
MTAFAVGISTAMSTGPNGGFVQQGIKRSG